MYVGVTPSLVLGDYLQNAGVRTFTQFQHAKPSLKTVDLTLRSTPVKSPHMQYFQSLMNESKAESHMK